MAIFLKLSKRRTKTRFKQFSTYARSIVTKKFSLKPSEYKKPLTAPIVIKYVDNLKTSLNLDSGRQGSERILGLFICIHSFQRKTNFTKTFRFAELGGLVKDHEGYMTPHSGK